MLANKINETRIVITGVGLTAPNANNLAESRKSLLTDKSGIQRLNIRYIGEGRLV
jgi:3-oxoacyl-[acyl-carrier-protein] synthase II